MSVQALKADIKELYHQADKSDSLPALLDSICAVLQNHEEALQGTTYSYRLCATDTGYTKSFSLVNGRYYPKTEADEADVIVSGTEQNLLAIFKRKLSPMSALLRGKIKVSGSKAALIRFAEFL